MKKIRIFVLICSLVGCCFLKAGAMEKTKDEKLQLTNKFDREIKGEYKNRKYTRDMLINFYEPDKNVIELETIRIYSFLRKCFLEVKKKSNELEYLKEVFSKYIEQFVFKGELELFYKLEEGNLGQMKELKEIFKILKDNLRLVFSVKGNLKEKKIVVLKENVPENCYFENYFKNIENIYDVYNKNSDKLSDYEAKFLYCLIKLRDFVVFYNTYSYYF